MSVRKAPYLDAAILCALVEERSSRAVKAQDFADFFNPDERLLVNQFEIQASLGRLEKDGLVDGFHDDFSASRFRLNSKWARIYEAIILKDDKENIVVKYRLLGKEWLIEVLENIGKINPSSGRNTSEEIPASDRFVTLDHNKPEVQDAIETIEAVIEEARKSNEFAALFADPDKRVVFLSEMGAGVGLAKSSDVVNTKTIKDLLLSKLEWIKEKLPDWSASALVSKAIESVIRWFLGG